MATYEIWHIHCSKNNQQKTFLKYGICRGKFKEQFFITFLKGGFGL